MLNDLLESLPLLRQASFIAACHHEKFLSHLLEMWRRFVFLTAARALSLCGREHGDLDFLTEFVAQEDLVEFGGVLDHLFGDHGLLARRFWRPFLLLL